MPIAACPSRSSSLRASPAKTIGGKDSRVLRTESRDSLSGYSGSWEAFFDFQLSILQLFEGEGEGEAAAEAGVGGLEDRTAEIDFDLVSVERDGIEVGLMGDLGLRNGLGRRDAAEVAAAAEACGVRAIAFAGIVLLRVERERDGERKSG